MEVLVPATTHPLADLAATLTATLTADTAPPPAGRVAAVLDAAVRAAAGMTGDAAAVRLAGVPGPAAVHHADPDRAAALARLLAETGDTDHPVVLDTGKAGPAGFAAVVVCPLRAGDGHLGYLALARTGTGEADVDLARGIAGEVALALTTARSIELMHTADERYRHQEVLRAFGNELHGDERPVCRGDTGAALQR